MIGKSIPRKESQNKVTGAAAYTDDFTTAGLLHAKILTSPHAHAYITSIDKTKAEKSSGVRAIITGEDYAFLTGSAIEDRPILAIDKVRYFGEPVAIVVADSEHEAQAACLSIDVQYELLPVIHTVHEALAGTKPPIHENLLLYHQVKKMTPNAKQNTANHVHIRKGNLDKGRKLSDVTVNIDVALPPSDHAAMETRSVRAEILSNGQVHIHSSSQAPFAIQQNISKYFMLNEVDVIVHCPLVGGAFGGKAAVQLELLAYVASKAAGGRLVKLTNSREDDLTTSPVHIGMSANVKLGATKTGKFKMCEIKFLFDAGAYVDESSDITTTVATNCTGPYHVEHVWCDSLCVYTNHTYATSFRGYGHGELMFAIERAIETLADELQMDSMELRELNAIKHGNTTPTQAPLTKSNIGNTLQCLQRVSELIHWEQGQVIHISDNIVRAKGISCLWKTSLSPTDATSGAIITFNQEGTLNLHVGLVEIGQGSKTVLAQLLAESMKIDISKIYVKMEVDTSISPNHWKTVASTGIYMVGNAVLAAAEDAKKQLKLTASYALRCSPEQLEVGHSRVYVKHDPQRFVPLSTAAFAYQYDNKNAIGGEVIGRGNFIMHHLTEINPHTGKGIGGPEWTVGAQAVEVELDRKTFAYQIKKAVSVIDAGNILNPKAARGQVTGAMSMGLSWASREGFIYDDAGKVENNQFRTYKTIIFDEQPEYIVEFLSTPQLDAPYGARALGEHGIIGMPAALANSLSKAIGKPLHQLPLFPETIWKQAQGDAND